MKLWSYLFAICLYANITKAQLNVDSLNTSLSNKKMTSVERINALNTLAAWYNKDSTNLALVMANEAYLLALRENNPGLQAASLLNLSEGYLYNDQYDQALSYGYSALDICQAIGSDSAIARAYTNLGWIFYDTENSYFALQYHQQAYDLSRKLGNKHRITLALNALGLVYLLKDEFETARKYFDSTIALASQYHSEGMIASALSNRGICENEFGKYNEALADLQKSLTLLGTADPLSHAEVLNQMAYSRIKLKEYPVAEQLLADARTLISQSNSNTRKEKLLDNLTNAVLLYQDLGEYKKAFSALQEYTEVRNQILSKSKSEAISALKIQREAKENERHIITLEAQKELRAFQRNALAAGVLLVIVIGLLYISKMKQKRKKEKELEEMRQALIKRELEAAIHEKESLNNKLEFRDNDLKNYALFISQRNDMIRNFIDELTVIDIKGDAKTENIGRFNRLVHKFQHDLDSNKDTQDFNLSVNEIHKDFFFNLLQKFPDLTENERRLCAQIRLNLSIKDIASLNNISVKSVEMARYRLRKAFNLEHKENLSDFLRQF
ncbi:tetratricopeptide repeat protein [Chitinophaga sp. Cy-1792]|uniref:tetratricopeptide repeat protein n=1 Tax=Chitinophaga sp. Cy-1792 TaxID=2608339 RepID=UPI0014203CF3|nr:tetratricopeptide repeat protein [Chitinophaga sp. Cy-1792]NIG56253.1 tetratricopeptide repeat protein [Chitinophaga sp. Cy-1792]